MGCRTTSTSGPTRTSRSTRWPLGLVAWGQDEVKATSELGRAGRGRRGRTEADRRGRGGGPGRRAAAHRDRERDPDLRPAIPRADLDDPGAGCQRPRDRHLRAAAGRRLRRRPARDTRACGHRPGCGGGGRDPGATGHRRRARRSAPCQRRRRDTRRRCRATTSTSSISRPGRSWAGWTWRGSSTSPMAGAGRRSSRPWPTSRIRPRPRRSWPDCSTGTPPPTRPH